MLCSPSLPLMADVSTRTKSASSSSDGKPRGILKRPGEGRGDSELKGDLKMALTEDEEKKYAQSG